MELYPITITLSEGGMSMQIQVAHPYSKCELCMRVCACPPTKAMKMARYKLIHLNLLCRAAVYSTQRGHQLIRLTGIRVIILAGDTTRTNYVRHGAVCGGMLQCC